MDPPTSAEVQRDESVQYLRSLKAVRERCSAVLQKGEQGQLHHFDVHMDRLPRAADKIIQLVERDYGPIDDPKTIPRIPPHGRWRHFGEDNMKELLTRLGDIYRGDKTAITMAILDLFIVAVLLDAGAGDRWTFQDPRTGRSLSRSEGLAVATLRMFEDAASYEFTADWLLSINQDGLEAAFQVHSERNPLLGVEGRLQLLHRLGRAVQTGADTFFPGGKRPGALMIYLQRRCDPLTGKLDIGEVWRLVMEGLASIWPPSRTKLDGVFLGDAWPCDALGGAIVPFHKLSQWLTYSLMEPLECLGGISFVGSEQLTGLAEYRNGGLFIDLDILVIRASTLESGLATSGGEEPIFDPTSQVVIEWRALTVALIDRVADMIRSRLKVTRDALPLACILEAGTWKAGRELAKAKRPNTGGGPPIAIKSDGTLF